MIKKIIISSLLVASMALPAAVHGEDEPAASSSPRRQDLIQELKDQRAGELKDLRQTFEQTRVQMQDDRIGAREEMRASLQAIQDDDLTPEQRDEMLKDLRETFMQSQHDAMEAFKQSRESAMAEFRTKQEEARRDLRTRLASIKDEKKKDVAEHVGEQFNEINARLTAQMAQQIDKIDAVLGRVIDKTAEAAAGGVDVGTVQTEIDSATAKIAAAREALIAQTAKVYEVNVTDEENLRNDFGAVRQQLARDLNILRDAMNGARDAVRSAGHALANVVGQQSEEGEDSANDNSGSES